MTNEQFFQVWDETIKEMEMVVKPEFIRFAAFLNREKEHFSNDAKFLEIAELKGIMWKTFIDSIKIN